MPQAPPRVGQTVTHPNGKKYIFEGVNEDGTWKMTPVGQAEGQSGAAGFARTLAQGATFGFSDELAGLGAKIIPGGRNTRKGVMRPVRISHSTEGTIPCLRWARRLRAG